MKDSYKILVENFNIKELKYEFGKQDIIKINKTKLKEIIGKLPFEDLIPARIITEKLIFFRLDENLFSYEYNEGFSLLRRSRNISFKIREDKTFKLNEFEKIINKAEKPQYKKIYRALSRILERTWFLFPFFNILSFFNLMNRELNKSNVNIVIIIFLVWLNIFCVYSLSYSVIKTIKLSKNPQRIKIEYSFQFQNLVETVDVSEKIVIFGQLFLCGFIIFYLEKLIVFDIIVLIGVFLMLPLIPILSIFEYNCIKKMRNSYLQSLLSMIHNYLEDNEKLYYFHVATMLKNKPLLSSENIPKFFTLFSILLTFIPIISYLFIHS